MEKFCKLQRTGQEGVVSKDILGLNGNWHPQTCGCFFVLHSQQENHDLCSEPKLGSVCLQKNLN